MMKMMKFVGKYAISNDTPMVIVLSPYYLHIIRRGVTATPIKLQQYVKKDII